MKITTDWLSDFIKVNKRRDISSDLTHLGLEVDKVKKVKDRQLIEIDITPNRADCLSIYGIARDLSALYKINKNTIKKHKLKITRKISLDLNINHKISPHYSGIIIKNVDNTVKTPTYISRRLQYCGITPKNLIVDILNFVMLEIGQPMHVFDLDEIEDSLCVRFSKDGERISCLDGKTYTLNKTIPVIADKNKPIAIAGIIGGIESSTTIKTKNVLIESAFFVPDIIRAASKHFRLQTDSSFRFERGVDPEINRVALERVVYLLKDIIRIKKIENFSTRLKTSKYLKQSKINLDLDEIQKVIGISLESKYVFDVFKRLDFNPTYKSKNNIQILEPTFRFDIKNSRDLIEEVARVYGYNNLPSQIPQNTISSKFYDKSLTQFITGALSDRGYNEVINFSFIPSNSQTVTSDDKNILKILNPISTDKSEMRTSMFYGLMKNILYNISRKESNLMIYENGKVYIKGNSNKIIEKQVIAGAVTGTKYPANIKSDNHFQNFLDVKGDLLSIIPNLSIDRVSCERYLSKSCQALIIQGSKIVGKLGQVDGGILKSFGIKQETFYFEMYPDILSHIRDPSYKEFSIYPTIKRDLTLLITRSHRIGDVIKKIRGNQYKHLINIKISDIFCGKSEDYHNLKSVTLEFLFQKNDGTLKDDTVARVMDKIITQIQNELKIEIKL